MYVAKIPHVIAQTSQNHSLLAALELNSLIVVYIRRLSSQLFNPHSSNTQAIFDHPYTNTLKCQPNQINNSSSHKLIPEIYPIT
jgi:hypothetical protein